MSLPRAWDLVICDEAHRRLRQGGWKRRGLVFFFGTLWLFNIAMENGPFIDSHGAQTSTWCGGSGVTSLPIEPCRLHPMSFDTFRKIAPVPTVCPCHFVLLVW